MKQVRKSDFKTIILSALSFEKDISLQGFYLADVVVDVESTVLLDYWWTTDQEPSVESLSKDSLT